MYTIDRYTNTVLQLVMQAADNLFHEIPEGEMDAVSSAPNSSLSDILGIKLAID